MSDWAWVALAYIVVYGTLGTYVLTLALRRRRASGSQ